MVTLHDYYLIAKKSSGWRVGERQVIRDICQNRKDLFSTITDIHGDYIRSLTPSQARVALSFLATFRNMFSTIASSFTYPAALEADRDVAFHAEHISPRFRIPPSDTLTGIGAAGVIGGLLTGPLLAILLSSIYCGTFFCTG